MSNVTNKDMKEPQQVQTCAFFVLRKNRFCRMLVGKGKRFCGQHLIAEDKNACKKRIPCPLDPKHSCFEDHLLNHLKVCNARPKPTPPFYCKGINEGEEQEDERNDCKGLLQDLSDEELLQYITKIEKVYEDHVDPIGVKIGSHPSVQESLAEPNIGHSALRHLVQNASLLALLEEGTVLGGEERPKAFVEFGSGRGKLTSCIIKAFNKQEESLFVLVDRGAQRYKVDAKLKHKENLKVKRLRIDIQDLDLAKVDGIEENSTIIACGKHLCGAATDFTLRCLQNCQTGTVDGIVIALCCHNRCTWKAYVGKEFLKSIGFTSKDFPTLLSLTGWAVSGSPSYLEEQNPYNDDDVLEEVERHTSSNAPQFSGEQNHDIAETSNTNVHNENRYVRLGLSVDFREKIGRKAKRILDQGRVFFLQRCTNLQASLIQYADQSSTLENIAIIAYKDR